MGESEEAVGLPAECEDCGGEVASVPGAIAIDASRRRLLESAAIFSSGQPPLPRTKRAAMPKPNCGMRLNPLVLLLVAASCGSASAADTQVAFDIPDTIECRDVTPANCAAAHPHLKVIEGKFRLSARITKGAEADLQDFLYMLVNPGLRLKIHDYLPNTTLESSLADDHIEVAENTENSKSATEDAHVGYKILSLGASLNQTNKKTESNHYKQIVPKSLVLASGTTNREHGVFFKLRPSNGASLEGAKEFTFLAIVPRDWRGDWCTVACSARTKKKSFLTSNPALAGIEQAHVGLYLSGDREASSLADQLCTLQEANAALLAKQLTSEGEKMLQDMQETSEPHRHLNNPEAWLHSAFKVHSQSDEVDKALNAMKAVQDRLARLSGTVR